MPVGTRNIGRNRSKSKVGMATGISCAPAGLGSEEAPGACGASEDLYDWGWVEPPSMNALGPSCKLALPKRCLGRRQIPEVREPG
jgi:hypothetical protein